MFVSEGLVGLAADTSGRPRELYVVRPRRVRWLRQTTAQVGWALKGSPGVAQLFSEGSGRPRRRWPPSPPVAVSRSSTWLSSHQTYEPRRRRMTAAAQSPALPRDLDPAGAGEPSRSG